MLKSTAIARVPEWGGGGRRILLTNISSSNWGFGGASWAPLALADSWAEPESQKFWVILELDLEICWLYLWFITEWPKAVTLHQPNTPPPGVLIGFVQIPQLVPPPRPNGGRGGPMPPRGYVDAQSTVKSLGSLVWLEGQNDNRVLHWADIENHKYSDDMDEVQTGKAVD